MDRNAFADRLAEVGATIEVELDASALGKRAGDARPAGR
jgi:hypothetical protein